jgi:fucose 4-O-acetylase-like acetyltransferase
MDRNRYADLLRVVAIGGVVYGHWLSISITDQGGQLSGVDPLGYIPWAQWLTWLFQVMPVFFLIGGYVNALSWQAHHARGESWTAWVRHRARRLLPPTAVFVVAGALAVTAARLAGVPSAEVAEAGWLVTLQLWFLPVYLLLIALTPVLLEAHRRWGLAVPAAMAAAAALVNVGTLGAHLAVIGYANFLFVWGAIHQWGFSWLDGTLTRRRWRLAAMTVGGAALLAGLLAWGPFSVSMVEAGNTNPPSVALLAFALTQSGLVLALEPAATRLLARARLWHRVQRLNATTMTVYLWHFVPVIVVAVACYPTGVLPQPAVGTGEWWLLRLAWWGLLTVVLVPLVAVVMRAERWLPRLPAGVGPAGPWSPALLTAGLVAVGVGLTKVAVAGLDPGGRAPVGVFAVCAAGLLAIFCSGRVPEQRAGEREITVRSG